jgi:hypothetical protein
MAKTDGFIDFDNLLIFPPSVFQHVWSSPKQFSLPIKMVRFKFLFGIIDVYDVQRNSFGDFV